MVSTAQQPQRQGSEVGEKTPGEDVHQQCVAPRQVLGQLDVDVNTGLSHLTPLLLSIRTATAT